MKVFNQKKGLILALIALTDLFLGNWLLGKMGLGPLLSSKKNEQEKNKR